MDIIVLLLLFLPFAAGQWQVCGNRGNYTAASKYQANLNQLSSSLPKNASSDTALFATGAAGTAPDTVYALALCRGDINSSECAHCVSTGFQDAQKLCPFNKDATVYYDSCLLRFSNLNFLATTDNGNEIILMNTRNFTVTRLLLFTLLNNTSQAAADNSRRFMTARMNISSLPTMYCAVQCTPDLTADECAACLKDFPRLTLQYLDGRQGGRVIGVRCNMRNAGHSVFPAGACRVPAGRRCPSTRTQRAQKHAVDYCYSSSTAGNYTLLYLFHFMDEETQKRKGELPGKE